MEEKVQIYVNWFINYSTTKKVAIFSVEIKKKCTCVPTVISERIFGSEAVTIHQPSTINHQPSSLIYHLSSIIYHLQFILYQPSSIISHLQYQPSSALLYVIETTIIHTFLFLFFFCLSLFSSFH